MSPVRRPISTGLPDGAQDASMARRDVLRLGGVLGVGAVLAGCGSPTRSPSSGPTSSSSAGGIQPSPESSAPGATTTESELGSASGSTSSTTRPTYVQLARQLSGTLSLPGQKGFQPKNLLYNPRFFTQRPPSAIAHVRSSADVAACVKFAAAGGASIRLRNGGHSYGGWSSGQGLVVDLAELNSVSVDHSAMTATVGAGALLADVYSELGAKGVSIGAGSCATVGVAGLTLGGGIGVLARSYGLTCDQLSAAHLVTADGKSRTVDAHTDADLFWALRGGGGSFGAVTSLVFSVRAAPRVQTFFLEWSWSEAAEVLHAWQNWMADAPRELWSTCKLLVQPGTGSRVLISGTWVGSGSPTGQVSSLLRVTPRPTHHYTGGGSYAATMLGEAGCSGQSASSCISAALQPAQRLPFSATSSILQRPLPSAGVAAIVEAVEAGSHVRGMVEGGVSFDALGGAISAVAADATAFPWRSALADIQYTATWPYAAAGASTAPYDDFVQAERQALVPYVGTSAYVNYADPKLSGFAKAYWGTNLARLSKIKKAYDPHDVFSFAQSVPL